MHTGMGVLLPRGHGCIRKQMLAIRFSNHTCCARNGLLCASKHIFSMLCAVRCKDVSFPKHIAQMHVHASQSRFIKNRQEETCKLEPLPAVWPRNHSQPLNGVWHFDRVLVRQAWTCNSCDKSANQDPTEPERIWFIWQAAR